MATGVLLGALCALAFLVVLGLLVGGRPVVKGGRNDTYRVATRPPPPPRGGTGATHPDPCTVAVSVDTTEAEAALARVEAAADRARIAVDRLNAAVAEAEARGATKH